MTDLSDNQLSTLRAIAAAGVNYLRAKPKTPVYAQLASKGLIEYNPNDVDEDGKHPYRLTPSGQAHLDGLAPAPVATQEATTMSDAPKFSLGVVSLPTVSRSSAGKSIYPFDKLTTAPEGPNSFFVPTGDRKNPSKSYGSIVSNQNKHAGFKKFTLRTVEDGEPWGHPGEKGVAVFILADEAPAAE